MVNVGLTGLAGSGKSTVSDFLINTQGYTRLGFADHLKFDVGSLILSARAYGRFEPDEEGFGGYGYSWEDAIDVVNNNKGGLRRLLQEYGSAIRSYVDENFWVKLTCNYIDQRPDKAFVVDDVRYHNEADALRKRGFVLIRIVRPTWHSYSVAARLGMATPEAARHQSETEQVDIFPDVTIVNDGTKERLCQRVLSALSLVAVQRATG